MLDADVCLPFSVLGPSGSVAHITFTALPRRAVVALSTLPSSHVFIASLWQVLVAQALLKGVPS